MDRPGAYRGRAGLELKHLLSLVQRPDPGESSVEVANDRFSAKLEHAAEILPIGQRDADISVERQLAGATEPQLVTGPTL